MGSKDAATDSASFEEIYTEQKLYDDMSALIKSGEIELEKDGKKTIRKKLRKHFKLDGKPFKDCAPFQSALDRVTAEYTEQSEEDDAEDEDADGDEEIDTSNS